MTDLSSRLRKRAEIRRQIPDRKSVQEGGPDRLADLLEEAADAIDEANAKLDIAMGYCADWDAIRDEVLAVIEPFIRDLRAMGKDAGPWRMSDGSGYREMQRESFERLAALKERISAPDQETIEELGARIDALGKPGAKP